jgi:hypothetical protein
MSKQVYSHRHVAWSWITQQANANCFDCTYDMYIS